MIDNKTILDTCLYFALNNFTRQFNKFADDIFKKSGLAPNYAFAILEIHENIGIYSSTLSKKLALSPSTITRFVDKLVLKGYVNREMQGKNSCLFLTDKGKELHILIYSCWTELHVEYSKVIGEEKGTELTAELNKLAKMFS